MVHNNSEGIKVHRSLRDRLLVKPRVAIVLAILVFLLATFSTCFLKGDFFQRLLPDIVSPLLNLAAALLILRAARITENESHRMAITWRFFAAAQFCYTLGDISWSVLELGFKQVPLISFADYFFFAYYPLFIIGTCLASHRGHSRIEWSMRLLDLGIVTIATIIGYWNFLVQPLAQSTGLYPVTQNILIIAYPILDLILITSIFWLINSNLKGHIRLPIMLLVSSAAVLIITDTLYGYQLIHASGRFEPFIHLGWAAAPLLLSLAGYFQSRSATSMPDCVQIEEPYEFEFGWQKYFSYIPYLWLIFAFSLLSPALQAYVHMDRLLLYVGVTIIGMLVVTRQIVTVEENRRLNRRLEAILGQVQQQASLLEATNKELQTEIVTRQKVEEQLSYEALHDPMTNLPNRTLFSDRLEQAILDSKNHPEIAYSVLFLDIDQFKVINDSMGHSAGDDLLIIIAQRLKESLRSCDIAARLGGDEFVILLENTAQSSREETVAFIVNRIQDQIQQRVELEGQNIFFTTSIGIVMDVSKYTSSVDVLRDADIAMYRAKALGKDRYEIFYEGLNAQAYNRAEIEDGLRFALENHQFELYYQPIVKLNTYELIGFESFIRWNHPTFGVLLPNEFIPVAEEMGLIQSIGQWVLLESCLQVKRWQEKHSSNKALAVQVNISGRQFSQPQFTKQVEKALNKSGLDPKSLKLEITEGVLIENFLTNRDKFKQLGNLGVQIEIDNFGSGYSSLAYIQNFPIQIIKIDRSFVKDVAKKRKMVELARAIISMAHDLGMETVAEGIETAEQMKELKDLGCDYGQGFLISDPLSVQMAGALLEGSARLFPEIIRTESK